MSAHWDDVRRLVYVIGAQKSGTTWLYQTLRAHPAVHVSAVKEVHYWDTIHPPHLPYYPAIAARRRRALERTAWARRVARIGWQTHREKLDDARRYDRMFAAPDPGHGRYRDYLMHGRGTCRVIADVSPGYAMMDADGFRAMDAAAPDARFVFLMRDPVDRLWSNMRHNRSRGFTARDLGAAFRRHLDAPGDGPFQRSDYARTLEALEGAVPPERIALFFYETLFDPAEMARMARVFGVTRIDADFGARVNPGDEAEARPAPALAALARQRLAHVYDAVRTRCGDQVPAAWMD